MKMTKSMVKDNLINILLNSSKKRTFPLFGKKISKEWYLENMDKAVKDLPLKSSISNVKLVSNIAKTYFNVKMDVVTPIAPPSRKNVSSATSLNTVVEKIHKSIGKKYGAK